MPGVMGLRLYLKKRGKDQCFEVKIRAYEVKIRASEVKIRACEVKIGAYEVKSWAQKSRHGSLPRLLK